MMLGSRELFIITLIALMLFHGRAWFSPRHHGSELRARLTARRSAASVVDRRYRVAHRHGAIAELFGWGPRGARPLQLVILLLGFWYPHGGLALAGAFLCAVALAIRSFRSTLSIALAAGLIYAVLAALIAAGAAQEFSAAPLLPRITAAWLQTTLMLLVLQFALTFERCWLWMFAGLSTITAAGVLVTIELQGLPRDATMLAVSVGIALAAGNTLLLWFARRVGALTEAAT